MNIEDKRLEQEEWKKKLERSQRRLRIFQVMQMRPNTPPDKKRALEALERAQRTVIRLRKHALGMPHKCPRGVAYGSLGLKERGRNGVELMAKLPPNAYRRG